MAIMVVKRGDIFYADLGPSIGSEQGGIRPVVIVQNDIANRYSSTVIVAAITSQINKAKLPTHIEISSQEYGINRDSVVLLEQVRVLDKKRLKEKISTVNLETIYKIDRALEVSFNLDNGSVEGKREKEYIDNIEEHKNTIRHLTKPLILTEGKTDVKLIKTAWNKLYPNEKMFFECRASGINSDKEKQVGNADTVRRSLEHLTILEERPIIGIFDNDREGNEQFKGLNKQIFEKYDIKSGLRKNKTNNIWGILLPVPSERKLFVTEDDITQRYFVIEQYFSDEILKKHKMYGKNILGTSVFKVNNRKDEFSKEVNSLDSKEFENFKILFSEIKYILNRQRT